MEKKAEEGKIYSEPAVRPPTIERLEKIAGDIGFSINHDELVAFQGIIKKTLTDTYQRLYELPDPKLPVKYPRTPGYRPMPEDNPYNAWYWRTDIKGADGGKLEGKTIAVKDNICLAGVPMMNGSRLLEGCIPDVDATVVTRILDAGGHISGKAVCENLCISGGSFTCATGPVLNPHDKNRMAGGSSSGSAALVAGGHVDMAFGGDQGGSIRIPSSSCGIVGLKPTKGLVPYTGIIPIEFTLDHVGPMARTVHDTALLLEVVAGFDEGLDPRQPSDLLKSHSFVDKLTGEISSLRIGVLKEGFGHPNSEKDVDDLVRECTERLAKVSGASLEELSIPWHLDGPKIFSGIISDGTTRVMLDGAGFGASAEGYYVTSVQESLARGIKCRPDDMSMSTKLMYFLGKYLQQEYHGVFYSKCQNLARELRKAYDDALENCDVIIMPTLPLKAPKFPAADLSLEEYMLAAFQTINNTSPFDVSGHPALTINAGFSDDLPVGMMIVGRRFDDAAVLNVAYAWEKIRDRNPALFTKYSSKTV